MAATTFVCIFCATLLQLMTVLAADGGHEKNKKEKIELKHVTPHDLTSRLLKQHNYVLIYAYDTGCAECLQDLPTVQAIQAEAADTIPGLEGLQVFASFLPDQMSQFGVTSSPALIFFRKGSPVLYTGVSQSSRLKSQDVTMWLMTAKTQATIDLNDENFEHDTQASTGATTGDWFVIFYDSSCDRLLPLWEAVAISLKGKKPVAKVNKTTSPNLVERFSIEKCPEILLFHQGKMYDYELPKHDVKTLGTFALSAYKNAKSTPVPKEPSPFDKVVEIAVDLLNKYPVLIGLSSGALLLGLIVILVVTSKPRLHDHDD